MARSGFSLIIFGLLVLWSIAARSQGSGTVAGDLARDAYDKGSGGELGMARPDTYGRRPQAQFCPEGPLGKVILYRTPVCPPCKWAAAYLAAKGIPYIERDIGTNPGWRVGYWAQGGAGRVPLLVIGTESMQGFDPASFDGLYARMSPEGRTSSPDGATRGPRSGALPEHSPTQTPVQAEPSGA